MESSMNDRDPDKILHFREVPVASPYTPAPQTACGIELMDPDALVDVAWTAARACVTCVDCRRAMARV
jgi:hypothetical protein